VNGTLEEIAGKHCAKAIRTFAMGSCKNPYFEPGQNTTYQTCRVI
jgi:hypothetical protein